MMCGIFGIIGKRNLLSVERELMHSMGDCLVHRGPDGEGEYNADNLTMGMRRLSIIDLKSGWQPLYNEDQSLALICNGEIYNYIELRHKLQLQGHQFHTGSDCETILHLYEEYGEDCLQYLRGMFAFALWDSRSQKLILARDRMGEKPLYIWQDDETLVFASEMKALLKGVPVTPQLDPVSVDLFFHYSYVVEPRTILCDIDKLPAGHYAVITVQPWQVEIHSYWNMNDAVPLEGDPVRAIRDELDTVSSLVIRSDVPVGVALSGGFDSSIVAALAVQKYPDTMHAFSIGYSGYPAVDERKDAQQLAAHLKLPFHAIELSVADVVQAFPGLIYHMDDPIADIAGYGYYMVNRTARENGVPVLLQGQGADELFWGYKWVRRALLDTMMKQKLMNPKQRIQYLSYGAISTLIDSLPKTFSIQDWKRWRQSWIQGEEGIPRWRKWMSDKPDRFIFYDDWVDFTIAQDWKKTMYTTQFASRISEDGPFEEFTFPHPWNDLPVAITDLISRTFLLENGIAQGDRLSMASSVELRLPLVDYRLVEIVIGHRKTTPDFHLPAKAWLKEACQGLLPEWVINRPKRGFSPPTQAWFSAIFKAYGNLIEGGYLVQNGILNADVAKKLANGSGIGRISSKFPFEVLCLELWCRRFLVGETMFAERV